MAARELDLRQFPQSLDLGIGHAAEKQVGGVFLEDKVVRIHREDAFEHADRAVDDRKDGQHRRHAEANARHPDEGAESMPAEFDGHEREEAHAVRVCA